jgi:hypothetical protein
MAFNAYDTFKRMNNDAICAMERNIVHNYPLECASQSKMKGYSSMELAFAPYCTEKKLVYPEMTDFRLGYETLSPEIDDFSTFHNYPVRNEDGSVCVKNHQVFHNHTRKKVKSASRESECVIELPRQDIPMPTWCDISK